MTNINCSSNCIYQKEGKCLLENISPSKITPSEDCAYFVNNKEKGAVEKVPEENEI